jgi:hypothetical protein
VVLHRVARFFFVQNTKAGKNLPKDHKINQMGMKHTKWLLNIPNGSKIYQMVVKYTKRLKNIPNGCKIYQVVVKYIPIRTMSFPRHSKIYPNRDFWFENIPSGCETIGQMVLGQKTLGLMAICQKALGHLTFS